jgi:uncharacterized Ntn-hydrolase superfamily protein
MRRRTASALIGAVASVLLVGCASPDSARENLLQATTDTLAAVRSGELALQLLDSGRSTHSLAVSTFVEMTDEVQSAEKTVGQTKISDPAQFVERDDVLAAVRSGSSAVFTGRDCLKTQTPCQDASDRLKAADQQLDAVERRLRGQQ